MKFAKKFKSHQVPRQQGEKARLKVIAGPDKGAIFVITGVSVVIGRGEEADVFITDLKTSRAHVRIEQSSKGWMAKDMDSANGIMINGKKSRGGLISLGDTLSLGDTVLEFVTMEAATMLLMAPARSMEQLQLERKTYREQVEKVRSIATLEGLGDHKKTAMLILGGLGLGILMFLSPSDTEGPGAGQKTAVKKKDEGNKSLASYLPITDSDEIKKVSDRYFKEGLREYQMENYGRARKLLDTVLQINPGHAQARIYIEQVKAAIDQEAQGTFELAKRSMGLGKTKEAESYFNSIVRLYQNNQTAPQYIEATEQLNKLRQPAGEHP